MSCLQYLLKIHCAVLLCEAQQKLVKFVDADTVHVQNHARPNSFHIKTYMNLLSTYMNLLSKTVTNPMELT
jgi:hypothetical protein